MELSQAELVERNQAIRSLIQTKGWKILEDHWRKQSARRRTEAANFLRNGDFNRATHCQGWVDCIESMLGEAEKLSHMREEEIHPIY